MKERNEKMNKDFRSKSPTKKKTTENKKLDKYCDDNNMHIELCKSKGNKFSSNKKNDKKL